MKIVATLLILIAISVSACHTLTEPSADERDYLVGWYKLPARDRESREVIPGPDTLIPVFKIDGAYYSVCLGFEIPLKECPEGLEWALTPSSMVGTMIGFDDASNEYYISIVDGQLGHHDQFYISGEKRPMTRIDKPSGLLDATAQRPRTNDDFLGWYQPVWFPWVRLEIRKDGEKYLSAEHELHEPGIWKTRVDPRELTPDPDRLGFTGFDRKSEHSLTYNEALKRFEITKTGSYVVRMSLAQVPPPSPEVAVPLPTMRIGIPSWH